MLFIGQVVYDLDNERVLIYCGTEMYQEQKEPYDCWSVSSFIDEEGNGYIYAPKEKLPNGDGDKIPFEYTNFPAGADGETDKIPTGFFNPGMGFFGCLDPAKVMADPKDAEQIKRTFEAAKNWTKPVRKKEKKAAIEADKLQAGWEAACKEES